MGRQGAGAGALAAAGALASSTSSPAAQRAAGLEVLEAAGGGAAAAGAVAAAAAGGYPCGPVLASLPVAVHSGLTLARGRAPAWPEKVPLEGASEYEGLCWTYAASLDLDGDGREELLLLANECGTGGSNTTVLVVELAGGCGSPWSARM